MNFANLLQGVVAFLWVGVIGLLVLAVVRASRGAKVGALSTVILTVAIFTIILTAVSAGLVFIEPDERGVVISALTPSGYRLDPLQPGLRWVIPGFERVERYPISRQTYTMSKTTSEGQVPGDDSISARTSDGQEVFIDASVIYAVDPSKVVQLHIAWQRRYTNELVRPLSRGVIRDAVSQFQVEEVYSTKRTILTQQITDELNKQLEQNGLVLDNFVLRNITFSPEYAASVEQKQIAEQQAEQAKFVVEQKKQEAEQARQIAQGQADAVVIRAKGDADARIIQAQAESQALGLIAGALQGNPDLLQYQYITKLAPGVQVMLVPNNAPYLLPLPTLEPGTASVPTDVPTAVPTEVPAPEPTLVPTPTLEAPAAP
jgi:regulator of protease activity HflC (stomatin/prohibitin superfamily)